jgi:hypothetical protein
MKKRCAHNHLTVSVPVGCRSTLCANTDGGEGPRSAATNISGPVSPGRPFCDLNNLRRVVLATNACAEAQGSSMVGDQYAQHRTSQSFCDPCGLRSKS